MRINQREKMFFAGAAVVIAVLPVYLFGVRPAAARIETLQRTIPEKAGQLLAIQQNRREYLDLTRKVENLKKNLTAGSDNIELLPYLEEIIEKSRLGEKVVSMQPEEKRFDADHQEKLVNIQMENITPRQLNEFLGQIKAGRHLIKISGLEIRKSRQNPGVLNTFIQFSQLQAAPPAG